jgi:hypothetical protein
MHKNGSNSDISAFSLNAVGLLPVTEQFDVFAKAGATRWSSDNTDNHETGFGINYGIGAKMHINETTRLRAEWEKFPNIDTSSSESSDMSMLSLGIELSTF